MTAPFEPNCLEIIKTDHLKEDVLKFKNNSEALLNLTHKVNTFGEAAT